MVEFLGNTDIKFLGCFREFFRGHMLGILPPIIQRILCIQSQGGRGPYWIQGQKKGNIFGC